LVVIVALALGLALAPITPGLRRSRRAAGWVGFVLVALLATELDPGVWPTGLAVKPFSRPIHGTDAAAGAALAVILFGAGAWWWRTGRPPPAGSPPGRVRPGRIAGWAMAAVGIIVHAFIDRPSVPGALNANPALAAMAIFV